MVGKTERILSLYDRMLENKLVRKSVEADRFEVNERTIQRDIDDIRAYLANDPINHRELVYDRKQNGYVLVEN